ncbi:unnamed protein product [Brassicogethes aeneus]|uniref:Uncharacterized protein n=1 Tax=Brassicogethes aeneus TaxID=1431903 RepID=A0A9P0FF23_BRAAE|nr:unnamed protein product [Brassicogethes aeneus]
MCSCPICQVARFCPIPNAQIQLPSIRRIVKKLPVGRQKRKSTDVLPKLAKLCLKCHTKIQKGVRHSCNIRSKVSNTIKLAKNCSQQIASQILLTEEVAQSSSSLKLNKGRGVELKLELLCKKNNENKAVITTNDLRNIQIDCNLPENSLKMLTQRIRQVDKKLIEPNAIKNIKDFSHSLDDFFSHLIVPEADVGKHVTESVPLIYCSNLSKFIVQLLNQRDLSENNFHIKFGLDSGGGSLKLCFSVCSLTETDEKENCKSTSIKKLMLVGLGPKMIETYRNIEMLFKVIEIHKICGICSYTFAADLKLLMIILGLQSNSSCHPCPWCDISNKDLANKGQLRTIENITKCTNQWKEQGCDLSKTKHFGNCVNIPLVIGDVFEPIIKYVAPPELHLLMGVAQKILDGIKQDLPEITEKWLKKSNIQLDHYNRLNGNNSRKLLKKDASSQEIRSAFKRSSLKLHPDKNLDVDTSEQFRNLVSIYEVLRSPSKRKYYDEVLVNGLPNWRSAVYYYRYVRKMGMIEACLILFVLITIGQYLVNWTAYYEKVFTIKSMQKKKNKKDNTDQILLELPKPTVYDTLPFQVPRLIWFTIISIPSTLGLIKTIVSEQLEKSKEPEEEEMIIVPKVKTVRKRNKGFTLPEGPSFKTNYTSKQGQCTSTQGQTNNAPPPLSGGLWTDDDLDELTRLVKKFPQGAQKRWENIAEALGRSVPEVTYMANKLKEKFYKPASEQDAEPEPVKVKQKTKKELDMGDEVKNWSQPQQKALEEALIKYPKGCTDRWDRVSDYVPNKTKVVSPTYEISKIGQLSTFPDLTIKYCDRAKKNFADDAHRELNNEEDAVLLESPTCNTYPKNKNLYQIIDKDIEQTKINKKMEPDKCSLSPIDDEPTFSDSDADAANDDGLNLYSLVNDVTKEISDEVGLLESNVVPACPLYEMDSKELNDVGINSPLCEVISEVSLTFSDSDADATNDDSLNLYSLVNDITTELNDEVGLLESNIVPACPLYEMDSKELPDVGTNSPICEVISEVSFTAEMLQKGPIVLFENRNSYETYDNRVTKIENRLSHDEYLFSSSDGEEIFSDTDSDPTYYPSDTDTAQNLPDCSLFTKSPSEIQQKSPLKVSAKYFKNVF